MCSNNGVDIPLFNVEGKQVEIVFFVMKIFFHGAEERNASVDDRNRDEAIFRLNKFSERAVSSLIENYLFLETLA